MKKFPIIGNAERDYRKRLLAATIVTCVALVMVFSAWHVVKLGELRMQDMRSKATYDLADMPSHVRAAGEDITRHALNEKGNAAGRVVSVDVERMLSREQWLELETMVDVPAGEFIMGTNRTETDPQNRPEHKLKTKAYRIDRYLVTVAQYGRFLAATRYRPPSNWEKGEISRARLLFPITMVNWHDAKNYCGWAKKRLPTESEWEKAARGIDGRRWPWGDAMDPTRLNTYYSLGGTSEVNKFATGVSPFGAYDMAGNVSQWTDSDFAPYPGSMASAEVFKVKMPVAATADDARNKVIGLHIVEGKQYKVVRGGSFKSDPFSTSTYHRNYALPNVASDFYGFRCAADAHKN
ncbi:MAG: SUMF1/EgtB/PvdO family nonheme iron enzyme [Pseudomonadota bacterium]